jgi:hypothetical protein
MPSIKSIILLLEVNVEGVIRQKLFQKYLVREPKMVLQDLGCVFGELGEHLNI